MSISVERLTSQLVNKHDASAETMNSTIRGYFILSADIPKVIEIIGPWAI